jgi:cytoskeletal protein CcmA (bactofilin family)
VETRSIDVGGSLKGLRVVASDSVDVGGSISTIEGTKAERVRIGRKGEIHGPVVAGEVNLEEGAEAEDIYAEVLIMEEGSSAKNIYAKKIYLERCWGKPNSGETRCWGKPQSIGRNPIC